MSNIKKSITSYSIDSHSRGSKPTRFKKNGTWVCPNHFPAVEYHSDEERCRYIHCNSVRPDKTNLSSEMVTLYYSDDTKEIFYCLQGTGKSLVETIKRRNTQIAGGSDE